MGIKVLNFSNQEHIHIFLMDKATWGGVQPTRIETHISTVYLVGDLAWKLKKAVRFPFLDFTSLDRRKQACERELALNAMWAAPLYLGLVPITQDRDGALSLAGDGQIVDYLVKMRRFPDQNGMLQVLGRGQVDRKLVGGLVQNLWDGYAKADVHYEKGGASGFAQIIDGLEPSFAPNIPADLFAKWRRELDKIGPLLDRRRHSGWVRRCHGDLHLGNVCLFEGALLPFDVLEFNEDFATIDVAYDVAFLIMDLIAHHYADFAALVMNRYLDVSGDYGCVAVLPLFLSVRAGVRAMVMHSMNRPKDSGDYIALAHAVLVPPKPQLVAVGGLSGSGKSRLSSKLSPRLGCPGAAVIRSDAIRKRLMGVPQTTKLDQNGYSSAVTKQVYDTLTEACAQILAGGFPVIADAVFGRGEERQAIQSVADGLGQSFTGLWLEVPFHVAANRVRKRVGDASDATVAVLEEQHKRDVGPLTWARINTDGTGDKTIQTAMNLLPSIG